MGKLVIYIYGNVAHHLYCKLRADDNLYDEKVSLIDGASVTIILC